MRAVAEFTKPEPKGGLLQAGRGHKSYSHTNSHTPQNGRSPARRSYCRASLLLLGSNQDSPYPEGRGNPSDSGNLPPSTRVCVTRCRGLKAFMPDFAASYSLKCRSLRRFTPPLSHHGLTSPRPEPGGRRRRLGAPSTTPLPAAERRRRIACGGLRLGRRLPSVAERPAPPRRPARRRAPGRSRMSDL